MTVFAVSSLRDYGNGETYFGTDGVFLTREAASEYVTQDMEATRKNYADVYEDDFWPEPEETCEADYLIEFDGHTFAWCIDQFDI